ncbi:hypothetical protein DIE19_33495 [Burkholderia sp. Bp9126]|nr:hypothetical protein DIE19_33495 [Burkholderia sp. Bp9126]
MLKSERSILEEYHQKGWNKEKSELNVSQLDELRQAVSDLNYLPPLREGTSESAAVNDVKSVTNRFLAVAKTSWPELEDELNRVGERFLVDGELLKTKKTLNAVWAALTLGAKELNEAVTALQSETWKTKEAELKDVFLLDAADALIGASGKVDDPLQAETLEEHVETTMARAAVMALEKELVRLEAEQKEDSYDAREWLAGDMRRALEAAPQLQEAVKRITNIKGAKRTLGEGFKKTAKEMVKAAKEAESRKHELSNLIQRYRAESGESNSVDWKKVGLSFLYPHRSYPHIFKSKKTESNWRLPYIELVAGQIDHASIALKKVAKALESAGERLSPSDSTFSKMDNFLYKAFDKTGSVVNKVPEKIKKWSKEVSDDIKEFKGELSGTSFKNEDFQEFVYGFLDIFDFEKVNAVADSAWQKAGKLRKAGRTVEWAVARKWTQTDTVFAKLGAKIDFLRLPPEWDLSNSAIRSAPAELMESTQKLRAATVRLMSAAKEAKTAAKQSDQAQKSVSPTDDTGEWGKEALQAWRTAPSAEKEYTIVVQEALRANVMRKLALTTAEAEKAAERAKDKETAEDALKAAAKAARKTAQEVAKEADEARLEEELDAALKHVPGQLTVEGLDWLRPIMKAAAQDLLAALADLERAAQNAEEVKPKAVLNDAEKAWATTKSVKAHLQNVLANITGTSLDPFARRALEAKYIGEKVNDVRMGLKTDYSAVDPQEIDREIDGALKEVLDLGLLSYLYSEKDPNGILLNKRIEMMARDAANETLVWNKTADEILDQEKGYLEFLTTGGRNAVTYAAVLGVVSEVLTQTSGSINYLVSLSPRKNIFAPRLRYLKVALFPVTLAMGIRKLKKSVRPGQTKPTKQIKKYIKLEVFKLGYRLLKSVLPGAVHFGLSIGWAVFGAARALYLGGEDKKKFFKGPLKVSGLPLDLVYAVGHQSVRSAAIAITGGGDTADQPSVSTASVYAGMTEKFADQSTYARMTEKFADESTYAGMTEKWANTSPVDEAKRSGESDKGTSSVVSGRERVRGAIRETVEREIAKIARHCIVESGQPTAGTIGQAIEKALPEARRKWVKAIMAAYDAGRIMPTAGDTDTPIAAAAATAAKGFFDEYSAVIQRSMHVAIDDAVETGIRDVPAQELKKASESSARTLPVETRTHADEPAVNAAHGVRVSAAQDTAKGAANQSAPQAIGPSTAAERLRREPVEPERAPSLRRVARTPANQHARSLWENRFQTKLKAIISEDGAGVTPDHVTRALAEACQALVEELSRDPGNPDLDEALRLGRAEQAVHHFLESDLGTAVSDLRELGESNRSTNWMDVLVGRHILRQGENKDGRYGEVTALSDDEAIVAFVGEAMEDQDLALRMEDYRAILAYVDQKARITLGDKKQIVAQLFVKRGLDVLTRDAVNLAWAGRPQSPPSTEILNGRNFRRAERLYSDKGRLSIAYAQDHDMRWLLPSLRAIHAQKIAFGQALITIDGGMRGSQQITQALEQARDQLAQDLEQARANRQHFSASKLEMAYMAAAFAQRELDEHVALVKELTRVATELAGLPESARAHGDWKDLLAARLFVSQEGNAQRFSEFGPQSSDEQIRGLVRQLNADAARAKDLQALVAFVSFVDQAARANGAPDLRDPKSFVDALFEKQGSNERLSMGTILPATPPELSSKEQTILGNLRRLGNSNAKGIVDSSESMRNKLASFKKSLATSAYYHLPAEEFHDLLRERYGIVDTDLQGFKIGRLNNKVSLLDILKGKYNLSFIAPPESLRDSDVMQEIENYLNSTAVEKALSYAYFHKSVASLGSIITDPLEYLKREISKIVIQNGRPDLGPSTKIKIKVRVISFPVITASQWAAEVDVTLADIMSGQWQSRYLEQRGWLREFVSKVSMLSLSIESATDEHGNALPDKLLEDLQQPDLSERYKKLLDIYYDSNRDSIEANAEMTALTSLKAILDNEHEYRLTGEDKQRIRAFFEEGKGEVKFINTRGGDVEYFGGGLKNESIANMFGIPLDNGRLLLVSTINQSMPGWVVEKEDFGSDGRWGESGLFNNNEEFQKWLFPHLSVGEQFRSLSMTKGETEDERETRLKARWGDDWYATYGANLPREPSGNGQLKLEFSFDAVLDHYMMSIDEVGQHLAKLSKDHSGYDMDELELTKTEVRDERARETLNTLFEMGLGMLSGGASRVITLPLGNLRIVRYIIRGAIEEAIESMPDVIRSLSAGSAKDREAAAQAILPGVMMGLGIRAGVDALGKSRRTDLWDGISIKTKNKLSKIYEHVRSGIEQHAAGPVLKVLSETVWSNVSPAFKARLVYLNVRDLPGFKELKVLIGDDNAEMFVKNKLFSEDGVTPKKTDGWGSLKDEIDDMDEIISLQVDPGVRPIFEKYREWAVDVNLSDAKIGMEGNFKEVYQTSDQKFYIEVREAKFQVRWDETNHTWRMVDPKKVVTGASYYAPPLKFDGEEWVTHADFGLKGGGKIMEEPEAKNLDEGSAERVRARANALDLSKEKLPARPDDFSNAEVNYYYNFINFLRRKVVWDFNLGKGERKYRELYVDDPKPISKESEYQKRYQETVVESSEVTFVNSRETKLTFATTVKTLNVKEHSEIPYRFRVSEDKKVLVVDEMFGAQDRAATGADIGMVALRMNEVQGEFLKSNGMVGSIDYIVQETVANTDTRDLLRSMLGPRGFLDSKNTPVVIKPDDPETANAFIALTNTPLVEPTARMLSTYPEFRKEIVAIVIEGDARITLELGLRKVRTGAQDLNVRRESGQDDNSGGPSSAGPSNNLPIAPLQGAQPALNTDITHVRNVLNNNPTTAETFTKYVTRPKEMCAVAAKWVERKLKDAGYKTQTRGIVIWSGGSDTMPTNHFVVLAEKDGRVVVVDLTAGQFDNGGGTGEIISSLDSWTESFKELPSNRGRLIRYQDFDNARSAEEHFKRKMYLTLTQGMEYAIMQEPMWAKRVFENQALYEENLRKMKEADKNEQTGKDEQAERRRNFWAFLGGKRRPKGNKVKRATEVLSRPERALSLFYASQVNAEETIADEGKGDEHGKFVELLTEITGHLKEFGSRGKRAQWEWILAWKIFLRRDAEPDAGPELPEKYSNDEPDQEPLSTLRLIRKVLNDPAEAENAKKIREYHAILFHAKLALEESWSGRDAELVEKLVATLRSREYLLRMERDQGMQAKVPELPEDDVAGPSFTLSADQMANYLIQKYSLWPDQLNRIYLQGGDEERPISLIDALNATSLLHGQEIAYGKGIPQEAINEIERYRSGSRQDRQGSEGLEKEPDSEALDDTFRQGDVEGALMKQLALMQRAYPVSVDLRVASREILNNWLADRGAGLTADSVVTVKLTKFHDTADLELQQNYTKRMSLLDIALGALQCEYGINYTFEVEVPEALNDLFRLRSRIYSGSFPVTDLLEAELEARIAQLETQDSVNARKQVLQDVIRARAAKCLADENRWSNAPEVREALKRLAAGRQQASLMKYRGEEVSGVFAIEVEQDGKRGWLLLNSARGGAFWIPHEGLSEVSPKFIEWLGPNLTLSSHMKWGEKPENYVPSPEALRLAVRVFGAENAVRVATHHLYSFVATSSPEDLARRLAKLEMDKTRSDLDTLLHTSSETWKEFGVKFAKSVLTGWSYALSLGGLAPSGLGAKAAMQLTSLGSSALTSALSVLEANMKDDPNASDSLYQEAVIGALLGALGNLLTVRDLLSRLRQTNGWLARMVQSIKGGASTVGRLVSKAEEPTQIGLEAYGIARDNLPRNSKSDGGPEERRY